MTPRVLALVGPTASGKTTLSLEIAERWGAVVLSADAMQVYRGMDIGTAKVTAAERARVPHYGIDLRDPDEPWDAADFTALAHELIAQGMRVIVVGGTSFYLRSLQRGLVRSPAVDPALRAELEALSDPWAALQEVDPVLAARLHPNDRVRIVRGLEVFRGSGERLSALHAEHASAPDAVEVVGLWLDREDLDARIDARVAQMMADGYLDEVQRLLNAGYSPTLKPMQSLGYRHLAEHLRGDLGLDDALERTRRDTRRLARKQRTWMRSLHYTRALPEHLHAALLAAEHAFGPPQFG